MTMSSELIDQSKRGYKSDSGNIVTDEVEQ